MQILGVVVEPPVQVYPGAAPEQSARHPVDPIRSPSSQISPGSFLPSPQIGVQTDLTPKFEVQVNPVSTKQVLEHPSPFARLLSSHYS